MDFQDILQNFKRITPDADYTRRSRSLLIGTPMPERPLTSPWRILVHSLELGSTIALAGVLIVLFLGGFSAWRFLSPFKTASLDPSALQAEAEAVDMQIELAKIRYVQPETALSTVSPSATITTKPEVAQKAQEQVKGMGLGPATSSPELTIDQVLNQLAE